MNDQEVIEIRASILWWFSTLLSKELNKKQFYSYMDEQGAFLLEQLACEPKLAASVQGIQQSLIQLNKADYPYLESAVEFAQVFLTSDKMAAAPYASVHLSREGLMLQQAHDDMLDLLKAQNLSVTREFNEPADHIAIQLDYLGNLVLASLNDPDQIQATNQQLAFIEQSILNWLPILMAKISVINNSGFYQNIIQLLIEYLTLEVNYLKEDINA